MNTNIFQNDELHHLLNVIACRAQNLHDSVYWAYGAGKLSVSRLSDMKSDFEELRESFLRLSGLFYDSDREV